MKRKKTSASVTSAREFGQYAAEARLPVPKVSHGAELNACQCFALTEPTNRDRRERALLGLILYKRKCLGEFGPVDESTLVDILTDLMHLSDANKDFPFTESLGLAERNHLAEIVEEKVDRQYGN